jgi:hypothetical protein
VERKFYDNFTENSKRREKGKMTKTRKIKFIITAVRWFDKVNGNTYHSCWIERVRDGACLATGMHYGYDEQYKQTALARMLAEKWIPAKYGHRHENGSTDLYRYERDNNYPIHWSVRAGLKRECLANGML